MLLGNDSRLWALWESDADELAYSALFDRVDIEDSGQFDSPFDKLVGTFVADAETRYRVRFSDGHVLNTLGAGTFRTDLSSPVGDAIIPVEVTDGIDLETRAPAVD